MSFKENPDMEELGVATVTTDSFIVGTLVTLYSFLKYNSWFNGEIIIICNELSDRNRNYLKSLYDKVTFFSVSNRILARIDELTKVFPDFSPKQARFYSLETFHLRNYKRVLFLDSDLLFRDSIEDLFAMTHKFIACGEGAFYNECGRQWDLEVEENDEKREGRVLHNTFNSGFFLVDNSLLTEENYVGLLELVDSRVYQKLKSALADQLILNIYFEGQQHLVSCIYNYLVAHRALIYKREKISMFDARVLHFNRPQKPWTVEKSLHYSLRDPGYVKACGLWFDSYEECLENLYMRMNVRGNNNE